MRTFKDGILFALRSEVLPREYLDRVPLDASTHVIVAEGEISVRGMVHPFINRRQRSEAMLPARRIHDREREANWLSAAAESFEPFLVETTDEFERGILFVMEHQYLHGGTTWELKWIVGSPISDSRRLRAEWLIAASRFAAAA